MFLFACKSLPRSLWRILLNYTAADKGTVNICSFKKLKKKKRMDWRGGGGGARSRVDFEEQLEDSVNPLGRFGGTKREVDLKPRSSSSCSPFCRFLSLSSLGTERCSVTVMSLSA